MNILHVYKDYYPVVGGIENHIRGLAEREAARGHSVSVLVNSLDGHTHVEDIGGVRVLFAARWATLSSTPIGLELPRLLGRERPDIAHLHFPYPWGEIAGYLFGHAQRTVVTYHSDIIRQIYTRALYRPLMWRILKRADRIIATSPNYVTSSPVLEKLKAKCVVIPLAIDPQPFEQPDLEMVDQIRAGALLSSGSPSSPGRAGRGESAGHIQTGAPSYATSPSPAGRGGQGERFARASALLLFVGQLRYYKGLDHLLRAMCELPMARLIVIGSGPMEGAWRALAASLGLQDRVSFLGAISNSELPAYYAAADLFVLPADERSEAFGLVQLEAMAAARPVVSTALGTGTSFVNLDGVTGRVVPPADPHALASAILGLMQDPDGRARMGAAGRARVHQEFTLDLMTDRVLALYEQLLSSRQGDT